MKKKMLWGLFIGFIVSSVGFSEASKEKNTPPELVVPQFDFGGTPNSKRREPANQEEAKDLLSELEGLLDNPVERDAKNQLGIPERTVDPLPEIKMEAPLPSQAKVERPVITPKKEQKGPNEIISVGFLSDETGKKLRVEASGALSYQLSSNKKLKKFVFTFPKTRVPKKLRRAYETKEFNSPLLRYSFSQTTKKRIPTSQLTLQMREFVVPEIAKMENKIILAFGGGKVERLISSELPLSSLGEDAFGSGAGYKGERLEKLELKNTEVGEAIKLVLRSTGYNVVLGDDVKGNIGSLSLRDTPWDQALHIILQMKKLGFIRQGNIVRIASLDTLKLEHAEIEKQEDLEPLKTVLLPVSYAKANTLAPRATPFLTKRGKIDVDDRTNTLIIRDSESVINRLQKLFAVLDTQPPMISISAKFLEVEKSFSRTLGLGSMSLAGQTSGLNFGTAQPPLAGAGLSAGATGGSINLSAPKFAALNAQLTLAESNNRAKTLSNPTIIVQQGQSGNITQGKTINIPQSLGFGGAVTTPLSVTANLTLTVTPVVANDGSISLDTNISDSTADTSGTIVTTSNRALRTQIILQNGDTAVLGGVTAGTDKVNSSGVPFLKDLPLLGYLFGSKLIDTKQNEVLIFITARILNPEAAFKQTI